MLRAPSVLRQVELVKQYTETLN